MPDDNGMALARLHCPRLTFPATGALVSIQGRLPCFEIIESNARREGSSERIRSLPELPR